MLSYIAAEVSWSVAFVIVTVSVSLKIYTRIRFLGGLFVDDYLILAAWCFCILGMWCIYTMLANGLERPEIYWIFYPTQKREALLLYFYMSVQFYTVGVLFCKLSLIYLYKRITRGAPTLVKVDHFLTALAVFCVAFTVVGLIMDAFWCKPLSAFWTDTLNPDKCSTKLQHVTIYLFSANNMASDFAIMLVPYFFLSQAALRHRTQRFGLYALFGVGVFVIATTVIKIIAIAKNFDISSLVLWSYIEACTALIVASVPSLPPLLSSIAGGGNSNSSRSRSGLEMQTGEVVLKRGEGGRLGIVRTEEEAKNTADYETIEEAGESVENLVIRR